MCTRCALVDRTDTRVAEEDDYRSAVATPDRRGRCAGVAEHDE